jgi:hypothetical protein
MRFHKSIKIAPGVKLNFSKSGISSTVGGKGLSVNVGGKGAYLNTGIPGTGISNRTKLDGGNETKKRKTQPSAGFENAPQEIENASTGIEPETQETPFDISKAKKLRKGFGIAAIVFGILGLLSIPTVIWAIIYLAISGFLFLVWKGANNMIKKTESIQKDRMVQFSKNHWEEEQDDDEVDSPFADADKDLNVDKQR